MAFLVGASLLMLQYYADLALFDRTAQGLSRFMPPWHVVAAILAGAGGWLVLARHRRRPVVRDLARVMLLASALWLVFVVSVLSFVIFLATRFD